MTPEKAEALKLAKQERKWKYNKNKERNEVRAMCALRMLH